MSEPLDLDAIEALANAATPGPWEASVLGSEGYAVTGPQGSIPGRHRLRAPRVARCGHEAWDTDKANAEHIAGMDPATTLALVAEVRALRAKVADLSGRTISRQSAAWRDKERARRAAQEALRPTCTHEGTGRDGTPGVLGGTWRTYCRACGALLDDTLWDRP